MNKINVAIIEDEIPAARLLHSMVSGLRPQWAPELKKFGQPLLYH